MIIHSVRPVFVRSQPGIRRFNQPVSIQFQGKKSLKDKLIQGTAAVLISLGVTSFGIGHLFIAAANRPGTQFSNAVKQTTQAVTPESWNKTIKEDSTGVGGTMSLFGIIGVIATLVGLTAIYDKTGSRPKPEQHALPGPSASTQQT